MSATPQFASTPRFGSAVINTANTNRDGTGTIGTVLAAGANGTRVSRIVIQAIGTTTAGQVRLFVHDGTNARLLREISVSALTPSATVQAFKSTLSDQVDLELMPLILPTGHSLRAATHNAESFNVCAYGGDF